MDGYHDANRSLNTRLQAVNISSMSCREFSPAQVRFQPSGTVGRQESWSPYHPPLQCTVWSRQGSRWWCECGWWDVLQPFPASLTTPFLPGTHAGNILWSRYMYMVLCTDQD